MATSRDKLPQVVTVPVMVREGDEVRKKLATAYVLREREDAYLVQMRVLGKMEKRIIKKTECL